MVHIPARRLIALTLFVSPISAPAFAQLPPQLPVATSVGSGDLITIWQSNKSKTAVPSLIVAGGGGATSFSGGSTGFSFNDVAGAITMNGVANAISGGTGLSSTPTNGQIDIGNGTGFTRTTLTGGTDITVTNGSGSISVGLTNNATTVNGVSCVLGSTCTITAAAALVPGTTTITGGASGDIEYNNAGILGEKGVTGTGSVVLAASPSIASPTITSSFTATGLVTNADLVNQSTTVNGVTCTLGTTCTISASAGTITPGTTTVASGTSNGLLYDNAGVLGNLATANSGVLVTSSGGVPSVSTTLPSGLAMQTPASINLTNATALPTTALTGTLQAAQEPAHTGDVTNTAGSLALTVVQVNGHAASTITAQGNTVTGTGSIVLATAPSITNANLNTPSAINLSNASSLPITAINGLGTGVAAALAQATNSSNGFPTVTGGNSIWCQLSGCTLTGTLNGTNIGLSGSISTADVVNIKEKGADPTGTTDATTIIKAALATGATVYAPTGCYKVTSDLLMTFTGQIVYGDGQRTSCSASSGTLFYAASNSFTNGVFAYSAGEPGPQFSNFSLLFNQPDTATRTALTNYPPAFYLPNAPRFRMDNIGAYACITCLSMPGNSGGAWLNNVQFSGFGTTSGSPPATGSAIVQADGSIDITHIQGMQIYPFDLTANQQTIFFSSGTHGMDLGRMDGVFITNSLMIAGTDIVGHCSTAQANTGVPIVYMNTYDFDTFNGIVSSTAAGCSNATPQWVLSNGGFSMGSGSVQGIVSTSGQYTIDNFTVNQGFTGSAAFQFSDSTGLHNAQISNGTNDRGGANTSLVAQTGTSPTTSIVNVGTVASATTTTTAAVFSSSAGILNLTNSGATPLTGGATGVLVSISTDAPQAVSNNPASGWTFTLPSSASGLQGNYQYADGTNYVIKGPVKFVDQNLQLTGGFLTGTATGVAVAVEGGNGTGNVGYIQLNGSTGGGSGTAAFGNSNEALSISGSLASLNGPLAIDGCTITGYTFCNQGATDLVGNTVVGGTLGVTGSFTAKGSSFFGSGVTAGTENDLSFQTANLTRFYLASYGATSSSLDLDQDDDTGTYNGSIWTATRSSASASTSPSFAINVAAFKLPNIGSGAGSDPLCWTTSTGLLTRATASCTVSDMRLKHDIKTLDTDALSEIMVLRPISYLLNDDPNKVGEQIGLGAQEVEKVDPRLVAYYEDGPNKGTPSGVRYEQLAGGLLVKGMQQQQAEIEALKAEIKALKAANDNRRHHRKAS